ncbi:MAG: dTMP kinase [Spirochaetaceae bacterium]
MTHTPESVGLLPRFIVIEGLDGAGTTTQTAILANRMRENGYTVAHGSEPTGSPVGVLIRRALRREIGLSPVSLAYLYAADRQEHVVDPLRGILAAHEAGWVLSDRYTYSSLAYQTLECPFDLVQSLNKPFPSPGTVVFLDTSPEVAATRRSQRGGEELFDALELQHRIYENYQRAFELAASQGTRIIRVDGNRGLEETADTIWKELTNLPIF